MLCNLVSMFDNVLLVLGEAGWGKELHFSVYSCLALAGQSRQVMLCSASVDFELQLQVEHPPF